MRVVLSHSPPSPIVLPLTPSQIALLCMVPCPLPFTRETSHLMLLHTTVAGCAALVPGCAGVHNVLRVALLGGEAMARGVQQLWGCDLQGTQVGQYSMQVS